MADTSATPTATLKLDIRGLRMRGDARISLSAVAAGPGIDYASLHDHEHGRAKRIDYKTLQKLKQFFGCRWDDLFAD